MDGLDLEGTVLVVDDVPARRASCVSGVRVRKERVDEPDHVVGLHGELAGVASGARSGRVGEREGGEVARRFESGRAGVAGSGESSEECELVEAAAERARVRESELCEASFTKLERRCHQNSR